MDTHSICEIKNCHKAARSLGWCNGHYKRNLRYGDPLGGNPTMKGEPLKFVKFAASAEGDSCLIWPFPPTAYGYGQLNYLGTVMHAHRAVLIEAGFPPPNAHKSVAAHKPLICHNPLCVRLSHIRWDNHTGNAADMFLDGTAKIGSKHHNAKLTEADIPVIRTMAETYTRKEIADCYGVSAGAITAIILRVNWKWMD